MAPAIPLSRPYFDDREAEAVKRVLSSGWVVQGPEVEVFEKAIADLHQAQHGIAVSSGTAALHVCYLAMGIGQGDAVFIPSFAWPSAANMAKLVGATPVFVDVLPRTYNLDPVDLERRIAQCVAEGKAKPRALVPVHEFGLASDMKPLLEIARRHSLVVIEDAACALGAQYQGRPVGTFGTAGTFSFHPRKSITTGEGGAIVTNDSALAERCRQWRNHGQHFADGQRQFEVSGLNYRMTEFQAAIGQVQLCKFEEILQARRVLVLEYLEGLAGVDLIQLPDAPADHTWQTLMVVLDSSLDRSKIIERFGRNRVQAGPGSVAGHLAKPFAPQPGLPHSEHLDRQGLALPLFPGLSKAGVQECVSTLRNMVNSGFAL